MTREELTETLKKEWGDKISIEERIDLTIRTGKEYLLEICQALYNDPRWDFSYLADLAGVDYPERDQRLEVVYHLYSMAKNHRLCLKVSVAEDEAVSSVASIWKGASAMEREAYDLLGIQFENHLDLRRIYLPPDWQGHPLRKDYPLKGKGDYSIEGKNI
ncbi:MAG: NADH-quinone oxidoreductase subunit C [bacterium]